METGQTNESNGNVGGQASGDLDFVPAEEVHEVNQWEINGEMFRRFFAFTGGSIFYCVSAALVAYGVSKVLGPVLSDTDTIRAALPCLLTLGVYELALLGVLILIVSRKVVDDAISVAIIMAIYMVATSIALGSVAERNIAGAIFPAMIGVVLAFVKVWGMRRYGRIPFGLLSMIGMVGLIAVNYFGPMVMAQTIGEEAIAESARRGRWFAVWGAMFVCAGLVWLEAIRSKAKEAEQGESGRAFLQSPSMVYVLTLVVLAASAVGQNATAYMFEIGRCVGDFVPVIGVASLIVLEILRRSKFRWGALHLAVASVPVAAMGYAICDGSVASLGGFDFDIIAYPPVFFAVTGAVLVWLSARYGRRSLLGVAFVCLLGVFLTTGFSPEEPMELNYQAGGVMVVAVLVVWGLVSWNYLLCLAVIPVITVGVSIADGFGGTAAAWDLTQIGVLCGITGLVTAVVYLVFGDVVARAMRIVGLICLAGFLFDYLPGEFGARYAIVLLVGVLFATGLWFRNRDWLWAAVMALPVLARMYIVARYIASWRFVILGFGALAVGTILSLKKPRAVVEFEEIDQP